MRGGMRFVSAIALQIGSTITRENTMKKLIVPAAFCMLAVPLQSVAEVSFSGFANVVAGVATDDETEYKGYDKDISLNNGSLFALQAYSDLTDGLSATVQVRAKGSDDWDPEFSWAFLTYEVTPSWRIQAGRQRLPSYLYSDYLDVSYAYHWIAPPSDVYSAAFDSMNGVSSIHDLAWGDAMVNLRFYYGQESFDSSAGGRVDIDDILFTVLNVSYDNWTFRTSYSKAQVTGDIGLGGIADAWAATPFPQYGEGFRFEDNDYTGLEFGVIYDNLDWLFVAEYVPSEFDKSIVGKGGSWMASVGKRLDGGKYMVHFTAGKSKVDANLSVAGAPTGVSSDLDMLIATSQAIIDGSEEDEMFYTAGARWDFHSSAALKAEYTHRELPDNDSVGVFQLAIVTVF